MKKPRDAADRLLWLVRNGRWPKSDEQVVILRNWVLTGKVPKPGEEGA